MMVAIGGSIYRQNREGDYSFLHAVHDHALHLFGEQMLEAEEKKPLNEMHPALQWMDQASREEEIRFGDVEKSLQEPIVGSVALTISLK